MPKFITKRIDGKAAGNWPAIERSAAKFHVAEIDVHEYDPERRATEQQIKWWWSVPVEEYKNHTGYSKYLAEAALKSSPFLKRFFTVPGGKVENLISITDITATDFVDIIECCIDGLAEYNDIKIDFPDKEWRKHEKDSSNGLL